ncbi:methyl-accepting chemotaxis protein [Endozoicomonas elysicola]|uniref:methyl-accepting chemotaxis protein n=2 Tax=Endozoicomonas elysicola TaxID=305900 RepID=UPI00037AB64A|nr:methyl-accepting chemotaxis protein [Endozoicomonas elysicola]
MWNLFLNNVKLKMQLFVMLVLVFIVMLAGLGGTGFWLFQKTEQLNRADLLLEKSEVAVTRQLDEWKNILLRGHDQQAYDTHLTQMHEMEVLSAKYLTDVLVILSSLEIDTAGVEEVMLHHEELNQLHISALKIFDPEQTLSYRKVDQMTGGEEAALIHELEALIQTVHTLHETENGYLIKQLVITCVLVIILAGLLIMFYSRALTSRLDRVVNATLEISKGNLTTRINAPGTNEMAQLGQSFNDMADSISELVNNVQQSGTQLSSTAVNISATTKEQAASAKEQEATTHEIMATSEHISQTARDLVDNMDEVARAVDDTSGLAEQGHDGLARMSGTVEQMVLASQNISDKLTVLNEKANKINAVVTTINKIADQTNLLSVNAAIEADKAGEYGVGFSTVATEIRRLADQTAVATFDIEEMVKEMQAAVSAGVMGMEKFSDEIRQGVDDTRQVSGQLRLIVEKVQTLGPHFESVHTGMRSQSDGAEQIKEALSQLSETIRNLNDSMRMSNSVVDELNCESERLQQSVTVFQLKE